MKTITMKKLASGLILTLIALIVYLAIDELSFSPLKSADIDKLFGGEEITTNKSCSIDFLGMNSKGEFFEAVRHLYKHDASQILEGLHKREETVFIQEASKQTRVGKVNGMYVIEWTLNWVQRLV